jgi:hypothetical protein
MMSRTSGGPGRRLIVGAEIHVPGDGRSFSALTSDLSPEGVFVSTFHPLADGTLVVVQLTLPGGALRTRGVVSLSARWSSSWRESTHGSVSVRERVGFRVDFEPLAPEDDARLTQLTLLEAKFQRATASS